MKKDKQFELQKGWKQLKKPIEIVENVGLTHAL